MIVIITEGAKCLLMRSVHITMNRRQLGHLVYGKLTLIGKQGGYNHRIVTLQTHDIVAISDPLRSNKA